MFKQGKVCWLWLGLLVLALIMPLAGQESGTKIKVIVDNASIRLKPSLESEAIEENIPLGTIYTSDKKVGEWYEIKFESNIGVTLIGYIHEMYVEVLAEEAPQPPAKEVEKPPLREAGPPEPAAFRGLEAGLKKTEIFIGGGLGLGALLNNATDYETQFGPTFPLDYMDVVGQVSHKDGLRPSLCLSLAHFFGGGFGLRLGVDLSLSNSLTGNSDYDITWEWWDRGPFTLEDGWDFTGSLSVVPISLNALYEFDLGTVTPYIGAGPAFFLGKVKMNTTLGLGYTWSEGGWRYVDYFAIPAYVDQSINGIGFNLRAGLDIVLSPSFGLTLDLSYFLKGTSEVAWSYQAGEYESHINDGWVWTLDEQYLRDLLDYVPPLSIKLSFFKILIGLKLYL